MNREYCREHHRVGQEYQNRNDVAEWTREELDENQVFSNEKLDVSLIPAIINTDYYLKRTAVLRGPAFF